MTPKYAFMKLDTLLYGNEKHLKEKTLSDEDIEALQMICDYYHKGFLTINRTGELNEFIKKG